MKMLRLDLTKLSLSLTLSSITSEKSRVYKLFEVYFVTFLYYSNVERSYELGLRIEPPKAKIFDLSSNKK